MPQDLVPPDSVEAEARAARRWSAVLLIFAALVYSYWPLGLVLNTSLDQVNGYVSELSAVDQPWSPLFRSLDLLAGSAIVIAAFTWWLGDGVAVTRWLGDRAAVTRRHGDGYRRRPRGTDATVAVAGWVALAIFGLGTMAVGAAAMDCAPYVDAVCAAAEDAGTVSPAHELHSAVSPIALGALALAGLLQTYAARRLAPNSVAAVLGYPWLVGYVAVSIWASYAYFRGPWLGIAERTQLTWAVLWLGVLAWHLLRNPGTVSFASAVVPAEYRRLRGGLAAATSGPKDGTPVVMLAGLGGAWFDWNRVVAELGPNQVQVIRIDRPGLGNSAAIRSARRLADEARRIADALDELNSGPAILVAHSAAALHAEACARLYPRQIAGLVLVDPSCELSGPNSASSWWRELGYALAPVGAGVLGVLGVVRGFGPWLRARIIRQQSRTGVEPGGQRDVLRVYSAVRTCSATWRELLRFPEWLADLRRLRKRQEMPEVPTVVLTGGHASVAPAQHAARRAGAAQRAWRNGHAELAELLAGRHLVIPGAGHFVHVDAPETVAAHIIKTVGALNSASFGLGA